MGDRVLDPSLVKDLSNHIYEKRKATAFQIESLTKAALARNDSQTINKIIGELADLTNEGTNSAKMGAITALGSVSVALGSFAIAYFLQDIIKPIFATFKDTDARVRYYACESLYNIAKIARGEILLYFNEIFDILCILVSDSESSVKNAADILDRLIKDIVSAKATNYVSIIQEQEQQQKDGTHKPGIQSHLINANGVAIQVNHPQDSLKAFSLPKFIPTLLERMYVIDPFAKKFLIGWLELFDDIPSLELITFLPNLLDPLIKFLMNNAPTDIRMDTENLLNIFLKEVKSIARVKLEVKKRQLQFERNKEQKTKDEENKSENEQNDSNIKDMGKLDISDAVSIQSNSTTIIHSQRDETDTTDIPKHQNDVDTTDKIKDEENGNEEEDIFLTGQNIFIDYPTIIEILLSFLRHQEIREIKCVDLSNEPHEIYTQIQFISLKWLHEILSISPSGFFKYLPLCISVIMQNLAIIDNDKDYELQQQFLSFNSALKQFIIRINESSDILDTEELAIHGLTNELKQEFIENYLKLTIDQIIKDYLNNRSELGKIASLEWLIFLYENYSTNFLQMIAESKFDLSELLKPSNNVGNDVILKVLQLLSKISETNDEFFRDFIHKLVVFVHQQDSSNRGKTEFVIRKLCVTLDAERIFKVLSEVLLEIDDLEFIDSMIVMLNNILLTAQELAGFRKKLKSLDIYKTEDWSLLSTLFQCWCHNAPSALSLCLLTSYYELAYLIIKNISESEVTYRLLVQIDILIQLLESPIFLKLRLQLLEPERNPYLYKTLYGLLMILPQSTTFNTLKNRLDSTSNLLNSSTTNPGPQSVIPTPIAPSVSGTTPTTPGTNNQLSTRKKRIYEMLDKFVKVHNEHEEYNMERRLKDIEDTKSERLVSHASSISERKDYFQIEPQESSRAKKPAQRINR